MSRVNDVGVAVGFGLEGDDEDMREAVGFAFLADVRAVLEADDRVDLFRQGGKGVDDLMKLGRSYLGLELVHHDVTEHFIGRGGVGSSHGNNEGKWNEGTKKTAQAT